MLIGLALAAFVSPFASSSPDGLERVSVDEGFDGLARDHDVAEAPLADYVVEGVDEGRLGAGLAGIIGVAITFAAGVGLFVVLRTFRGGARRPSPSPAPPS
jgi:hypothetical protein